jgi:hypothetical protein
MFRCQKCGTVVPANVRTHKIVVATRPKTYEPRGQDPSERRGRSRFQRGRRIRKRKPYDKGGQGTEIVRELSVCPKCAADLAAGPPETVGAAHPELSLMAMPETA